MTDHDKLQKLTVDLSMAQVHTTARLAELSQRFSNLQETLDRLYGNNANDLDDLRTAIALSNQWIRTLEARVNNLTHQVSLLS